MNHSNLVQLRTQFKSFKLIKLNSSFIDFWQLSKKFTQLIAANLKVKKANLEGDSFFLCIRKQYIANNYTLNPH